MRKLWLAFTAVVVLSFAVLGWTGVRIYQEAPPVPTRVVTTDGRQIIGPDDIYGGQNVWQSIGGMEVGSVWGHGSYVAPDWTADWLHREADVHPRPLERFVRRVCARLPAERQAALQSRLQQLMRTNTYDPAHGTLTIDPVRAAAFDANVAHYTDVFAQRHATSTPFRRARSPTRTTCGSWRPSSSGRRGPRRPTVPNDTITYTSNWPHEPLVGNRPTGDAIVWTGVSIIVLLAGIGAMVCGTHASIREHGPAGRGARERSAARRRSPTPSQRAVVKYFWVVSALILVQILLGVVAAHYGVEGERRSTASRSRSSCRTSSPARGTCSSASSGSPRPGWPPACSSARR